MRNFLSLLKFKLQTKRVLYLESSTREVVFEFPKKYRVRYDEDVFQVFDLKDEHFLLNFSIYTTEIS